MPPAPSTVLAGSQAPTMGKTRRRRWPKRRRERDWVGVFICYSTKKHFSCDGVGSSADRVLCFSLVYFSLSQDGFTQISLAWRQKTYCWQEELMAVFWQGPVKVTLETLHFLLGKLQEKERILRVFSRGEMLGPHLDNLWPSFRVWRSACCPVGEALPVPWPTDQVWFRPAVVFRTWPPESERLGESAEGAWRWAFSLLRGHWGWAGA